MAVLKRLRLVTCLLFILQNYAAFSTEDSTARAASTGSSTADDAFIECNSQQEACACDENVKECRFRLKVEEIQTFTSYQYRAENKEELLVRGFCGSTYYFNGSAGIRPSIPQRVVACPFCSSDDISNLADFRRMNCSIPMMVDGRTYHSIIAVNDLVPGPTLVVTEGQTVIVDVHNKLASEGVTIHWHGLHQQGTPWMDGVGLLSQAPITPGSVFRYMFTAGPSGTHWYHSHVGTQRTDGLFGAFVIREKMETRKEIKQRIGEFEDLPELFTITLWDFLRENSFSTYVKAKSILRFYSEELPLEDVPNQTQTFIRNMLTTDGSNLGPLIYWSGLINGRGRYDSTTYSLLSVFNVDVRMAYRFRVVGAQGLYVYRLEVVGHKLKVISSDGHLFVPVEEVDFITVHAGERYDFILTADQAPGNYLIRAQVLGIPADFTSGVPEFVNLTAEAVLHYNDISVPQPDPFTLYDDVIDETRRCGPTEKCRMINCPFKEFPSEMNIHCIPLTDLQSLFPKAENDLPDLRSLLLDDSSMIFLNFGFDGNVADPSVNGRTFQLPPTPYQTYPGQFEKDRQVYPRETCQYCQEENASTEKCDCTYAIQIAKGMNYSQEISNGHVIMIYSAVTLDASQELHPIHLHGHNFFLVHVGYGEYDNGVLLSSSNHIDCGSSRKCLDPKWNESMRPDFTKYMSSSGKLKDTAILKDTVIVPAGGYVVVAVPLDNPGYWLLHCHAEPHLFKGMAVIVQEYPEDQHPPAPLGINKVGHFLEPNKEQLPSDEGWESDGWMVGAVVALCLVTVAVIVIVAQSVVIMKLRSGNNVSGVFCHSQRKGGTKYIVFSEHTSDSEEFQEMNFSADVNS